MDSPYGMDRDKLRRLAEGRLWACALDGADAALGADARRFTALRAIEALRIAAMIRGWPDCYTLDGCAGVLLARAGHTEEALALCDGALAETPAKWQAAEVHAAIAARLAQGGDHGAALAHLRATGLKAQGIGRIYERGGEYPAVYDLFEAMGLAGLGRLVDDVADTLVPGARAHARRWRADWRWAQDLPLAAEDRLVAIADEAALAQGRSGDLTAVGALDNRIVAIATLAALARDRVLAEAEAAAVDMLHRALTMLPGSFGEEGQRALIYHEETRFTAALGLGAAIRCFVPGDAHDLADAALALARDHDDAFAGGALVHAAGAATII